ncbi:isoprenylcysteine carboxylmethyltransferase family protein [Lacisediminimonas sp.]|uniref:methyltransferase family protein n=1 Tax=Lacisediminimonas sp. TaxID=3060582 RepID=UPI00272903DC|nr:methyltransferase [Lacisediminimonas sp.]MDO8299952.1 methyltransferase [Lacisediminimonas sp.]MDO9219066.1 methyltransferase [Lacisediminimonas sp.]
MSGLLLLTLQMGLLLMLAWPWRTAGGAGYAWVLLLAGVAMGLWSLYANRPGNFNLRPDLKPNARLITTGPYAYVQHPMYVAVLLLGLGLVVLYLDWIKFLLWLLLFIILHLKSAMEERALDARFAGYREYAGMTGRFFPKIRRA